MAIRPPDGWLEFVADEKRGIAAGTIRPEDAFTADLFPEKLLARTDETLTAFEADLAAARALSDEPVFAVIERVVPALNQVNREFGGTGYETEEREQQCDCIDRSLTEAGIAVPAPAARRGIGRYSTTDDWRDW